MEEKEEGAEGGGGEGEEEEVQVRPPKTKSFPRFGPPSIITALCLQMEDTHFPLRLTEFQELSRLLKTNISVLEHGFFGLPRPPIIAMEVSLSLTVAKKTLAEGTAPVESTAETLQNGNL